MKKLTILLFSILISFSTYGEWVKVTESTSGDVHYIDVNNTIKQNSGYIYYWVLSDYTTPLTGGYKSSSMYKQGDCGVNRHKSLSYNYYKQPMGDGESLTDNSPGEWRYPAPGTIGATLLNYACNYVK